MHDLPAVWKETRARLLDCRNMELMLGVNLWGKDQRMVMCKVTEVMMTATLTTLSSGFEA